MSLQNKSCSHLGTVGFRENVILWFYFAATIVYCVHLLNVCTVLLLPATAAMQH